MCIVHPKTAVVKEHGQLTWTMEPSLPLCRRIVVERSVGTLPRRQSGVLHDNRNIGLDYARVTFLVVSPSGSCQVELLFHAFSANGRWNPRLPYFKLSVFASIRPLPHYSDFKYSTKSFFSWSVKCNDLKLS